MVKFLVVLLIGITLSFLFGACDDGGSGGGGCDGGSSGGTGAYTLDQKYSALGGYPATSTKITDFTLYHPQTMGQGGQKHPILTWGNGTGMATSNYDALLMHLASWGFVVVATDSTMTLSGEEMLAGVDYLISENSNSLSAFYNKLDVNAVAAIGHSQGGWGVMNAAKGSNRIKCTVPIQPGPGRPEGVTQPMFLIGGTDDHIVNVDLIVRPIFNNATCPVLMGVLDGATHFETTAPGGGRMRSYITAFLLTFLNNDQTARGAFYGGCEICNNTNWEVTKKNW